MLQQLYTKTLHVLQVIAANERLWKNIGFKEKLDQESKIQSALTELDTFKELESYASSQKFGAKVVQDIRKLEVSPNKWLIFTNKQFMSNLLQAKDILQKAASERAMASVTKFDTILWAVRKVENLLIENQLLIQKSALNSIAYSRAEAWHTALNTLGILLKGLSASKAQDSAVMVEVDSEKMDSVLTNLLLLDAKICDVVSYLQSCKEAEVSASTSESEDLLGVLLFSSQNVEDTVNAVTDTLLADVPLSTEPNTIIAPELVEEIFVPSAVSDLVQKKNALVQDSVYTEQYVEPSTVTSPSWACRQDAEESASRYSAPDNSFDDDTSSAGSVFSQDSDTSSCTPSND